MQWPCRYFSEKNTSCDRLYVTLCWSSQNSKTKNVAMTASFGLPCVLFTITPEDAVNVRIRVMAKGEAGSQIPPSVGSEEGIHRDYVMESEKIRIENPGLCAIDFENVIGIVVEEILGWDRKNNCNKVGYGLFGDLDAWSFAVEEQGRKTLHAHFLLWVKGYNELIEGLSTPEGQEEYVKKVSKYVDRVMSTRLHGFNPRSVPNACNNDCTSVGQGIEGYLKCTTQDLRQLRTKHGETSFREKKLVWCPTCNVKVSSEDQTFKRLKRYFGNALLGENETLWSTSRHLSKCRLLMEMEVLHAMLPSEVAIWIVVIRV
ncbi:helitron helicase-like protein [Nitzschia inconspicua]|uniref:Helitron helicase-like protein n=1 Tax=Nitzschia inconspicua TaxID=303405 RepID=A0A9K3LJ02_9STRA|nr:helitron helicase-like protein [Nitzschia inconspicua]